MTNYIGEFQCTMDVKGRVMMPAGLYKQFPTELREKFVINRSVFQKCLVLYPMDAWEEIVRDLSKLNRFRKENDDFIRQYTNGASTVELDATNRFLLPKHLVDFAKIKKDIVLTSSLNKIEIWSDKSYKDVMKGYDPDAFAQLAEKVMGGNSPQQES